MAKPYSIYSKFLNLTVRAGLAATMVASLSIFSVGFIHVRSLMIDHFKRETEQAASGYRLLFTHPELFSTYLEEFAPGTEATRLCAYDTHNALIAKWQEPQLKGHCPSFMTSSGITASALSLTIALPVEKDGNYLGMIYLEAELLTLKNWIMRGSILLISLLIVCWAACHAASRWSTRLIIGQLKAVQKQVECLKNNDIAVCALPEQGTPLEIAELSEAITSLRSYLDDAKVPKEEVVNLKRWYWEVLNGLLATLRQRLDADSPLLENLSDYTLLVQAERGDIMPPVKSFDLAKLLDASLSRARKTGLARGEVNLTASLQSHMPRCWAGQPDIIEALLKHIIQIGLKRTTSGFVCLRVEVITMSRLRICLEDSGPPIQRWQLAQWLAPAREETPPIDKTNDISWLLVSRLIRRLQGNLSGTSSKEGGLMLEAILPLIADNQNGKERSKAKQILRESNGPPLVLAVESDNDSRKKLADLFAKAGCRIFLVATHAAAMEWVGALPFSAIILDTGLVDSAEDIVRRLTYMRDEGALADLACWAIIAGQSFTDLEQWQKRGINEFLIKPLQPDRINLLAASLSSPTKNFFRVHDKELHQELPASLSIARMEHMLKEQVSALIPSLAMLATGNIVDEMAHQSHAVKSVALNLGFFRLAALMGQIEYSISNAASFAITNWQIIADCLKALDFADLPDQTLPSAATYHHNGAPDHNARQED